MPPTTTIIAVSVVHKMAQPHYSYQVTTTTNLTSVRPFCTTKHEATAFPYPMQYFY